MTTKTVGDTIAIRFSTRTLQALMCLSSKEPFAALYLKSIVFEIDPANNEAIAFATDGIVMGIARGHIEFAGDSISTAGRLRYVVPVESISARPYYISTTDYTVMKFIGLPDYGGKMDCTCIDVTGVRKTSFRPLIPPGDMPEFRSLIPESASGKKAAFAASTIKKLNEAARTIGGGKCEVPPTITQNGDRPALVSFVRGGYRDEFFAIAMPAYFDGPPAISEPPAWFRKPPAPCNAKGMEVLS